MAHRTRLLRRKQPSRPGDSSRGPLLALTGVIVTALASIAVALIQSPGTTGATAWPTLPTTPANTVAAAVPPHDTIGCWQDSGGDQKIDIVNHTTIYNTPWPSGDPTTDHCYPPGYPPLSIDPTRAQIYCWAHGTTEPTTDASHHSGVWYRLDGANAHYGGYWVNAVDATNNQHIDPPPGLRRCYP